MSKLQGRLGGWTALMAAMMFAAMGAAWLAAADLSPDQQLAKADEQFEKKNYLDAANAYRALLDAAPQHEKWRHANERLISSHLRLQQFDSALAEAGRYVERCKDTPWEARAERLTGNLYMLVPHWGTRAGGVFHRGQWMQGIRLRSHRHDKAEALKHMERARALYAHYDANRDGLAALPEKEREQWHNERIECLFDLAAIHSRFGIYENSWMYWYGFWGERDETLADTAGEEDFDEYYNDWQWQRKRPIGLRVDEEGKAQFPFAAKEYDKALNGDQKLLFLLEEARQLDQTQEKRYVALSYYRQAMLARARFGMDRLNSYAGMYYSGDRYPLQDELKAYNPWELTDGEALVLAGGAIRKVTLPAQWDVLGLLRKVHEFPAAGIGAETQYAIGLYHQSRQQYVTALGEYAKLKEQYAPKGDEKPSDWLKHADTQVERIKAPQVQLSDTGVQLPHQPAALQLSYRNVAEVHFVARRIDHLGYMNHYRNEAVDPNRGTRHFWAIGSWHGVFAQGYHEQHINDYHRKASEHLGPVVAQWSQKVADNGTHRYSQIQLQSQLSEPGAYLVYAYVKEPPKEHLDAEGLKRLNFGDSRAVVAMTDLAFIDKPTSKGDLVFVTHAVTGAPVAETQIKALELWQTYDQQRRRWTHHRKMHDLKTDGEGVAIVPVSDKAANNRQLHVVASAGEGRAAWSGMQYWSIYHPSQMQEGAVAYVITDRPVYRPGHRVRYKVWLRDMRDGQLHNTPDRKVRVVVVDPKGNHVQDVTLHGDQFGGVAHELTLGEEPPLGVYQIQVHDKRHVGGQSFRVEEYRKPEFEVTVEPGKTQAKLGEKLTAVVKATYYFGSPVTDATVSYKVFREEYRHSYYFSGEWDWLYGPGYGYSWYSYDWLPWWGAARRCWAPPAWWWDYAGGGRANPVRELVMQGTERISGDGEVKLEIDTAAALRDHGDLDHRYVIEAEVRDASRRVVTGTGDVKVTRQSYYAFISTDQGYYVPGQEMAIELRCLTPDQKPIAAEGVVTVSEVVYGGPDNSHVEETLVDRFKAVTDAEGKASFRFRYEKSGQLKIKFTAPDQWGGNVTGYGHVWVVGRDFTGQFHRFNDLEIISDKRTYQPGETAHILINTARLDSHVLFSSEVDNSHLLSWKVLHIPGRSIVVDVPIGKTSAPNFYIEATTISDTRVHQQAHRIAVPPASGVLKVEMATDKKEYQPGDKARVSLTARDLEGNPVEAQITLAAFDRSVLYIQPEMTPPIAEFFHGRLRYHSVQMTTNLLERFSAIGYVGRPFEELHPLPPAWWGVWGPNVRDWRAITDEELADFSGESSVDRLGDPQSVTGLALETRGEAKSERGAMLGDADGARPGAPAAALAADGGGRLRQQAGQGGGAGSGEPTLVEPTVRTHFADTAAWVTTLTTDSQGHATTEFTLPDNLTTWKLNSWAMTRETKVGQQSDEVVTSKDLIVRLQTPRFFVEFDQIVLSANVHNYLPDAKPVRVSIELDQSLLKIVGDTPQTVDVTVPAGGEQRVDWRVQVLRDGLANVTVKGLTDEQSDAMSLTVPALVHGLTKQVATTGHMPPDEENKSVTVELNIPEQRRAESTRLEVQYSPTLAGAMLDALPYTLYYPYESSEATVSRFLPAVLTLKTLRNLGLKLEDVRTIRGRLDEIRRVEKGENIKIVSHIDNPVFDQGELDRIIAKSLQRIGNMQNGDGGWGWWSGSSSSPYFTAYILHGLTTAQQEADVAVRDGMVEAGMNFLKGHTEQEMAKKQWSVYEGHAFAAYVLSKKGVRAALGQRADEDKRPADLIERLFEGRDELNLYGKALLALTLANHKDADRAALVLRNIMQFRKENAETQVAWFESPQVGWWHWWNNDIETNAWILRAIVKIDPKNETGPQLVKWLLNNRRNGYYWRSTRDTTLCVSAMSDFAVATGEADADYTLTLDFDEGKVVKTVKINKDTFFTYDNQFLLEGVSLTGGKHTLRITKQGKGAVYFNTYLRYFTKEKPITAAGHELKVQRRYFRLRQIPFEVTVEGAQGQSLTEKRLRYERMALADGESVPSGEVIQVELQVTADNDYTYLAFEDMKPAGFEPIDQTSGGKRQEGFASYMELRDEKVVFFADTITRGDHLLRYRLRAEQPGEFHALPTRVYAVYVPELMANSDERIIRIVE